MFLLEWFPLHRKNIGIYYDPLLNRFVWPSLRKCRGANWPNSTIPTAKWAFGECRWNQTERCKSSWAIEPMALEHTHLISHPSPLKTTYVQWDWFLCSNVYRYMWHIFFSCEASILHQRWGRVSYAVAGARNCWLRFPCSSLKDSDD